MKTMTKPYSVAAAALAVLATTAGLLYLLADEPTAQPSPGSVRIDERGSASLVDGENESRPDDETSRTAVAETNAHARTAVRVVARESGAPLPDAIVVVLDAVGKPAEFRVDDSGWVELDLATARESIAAWAPSRVPAHTRSSDTARDVVIELDRGSALSGVVLCDAPHADLEDRIELVPNDDSVFRDWPPALGDALRSRVTGASPGPIELDATGHFAIGGLPATWRGRIDAANGFQVLACEPGDIACRPSGIILQRPVENLRIQLAPTQLVAGHVIWVDDGTPVTEGTVSVAVLYENGNRSYITNRRLDIEGRFRAGVFPYAAPYTRPSVESIRIDVHPDRGERRRVVWREWSAERAIEPIRVHRVAPVHVLVVDAAGEPIPSALVAGEIPRDYGVYRHHVRADSEGRAVLRKVARDVDRVTVGAIGYRVTMVPIEADRGTQAAPIHVELARANELTIEVVPHGVELDSLTARLRHDGALLTAEAEGDVRKRFLELLGAGSIDEPGVRIHWFGDGSREWRLSGLLPDRPLTAEVCDASDNVLARAVFRSPGLSETRRVRIDVSRDSISIRGKVVGPDGGAIAGARVRLDWEGRRPQWIAATGSDGTFTADVASVPGRVARAVLIAAPGHANLRHVLPAGLTEGDLGRFHLAPGHVVEVSAREPSGREHAPTRVRARVEDGQEIRGQYIDGRRRLAGLPNRPLTVVVEIGGREYSRSFASPPQSVVFEVPNHGTLAVDVPGAIANFYPDDADSARIVRANDEKFEMSIRTHQPARFVLVPGTYSLVHGAIETSFEIHAGRVTRVSVPASANK